MTIHYDSTAALTYAKDLKYQGKIKHIEVRYNFIKDMIMQNEVILKRIPTSIVVKLASQLVNSSEFKGLAYRIELIRTQIGSYSRLSKLKS